MRVRLKPFASLRAVKENPLFHCGSQVDCMLLGQKREVPGRVACCTRYADRCASAVLILLWPYFPCSPVFAISLIDRTAIRTKKLLRIRPLKKRQKIRKSHEKPNEESSKQR